MIHPPCLFYFCPYFNSLYLLWKPTEDKHEDTPYHPGNMLS